MKEALTMQCSQRPTAVGHSGRVGVSVRLSTLLLELLQVAKRDIAAKEAASHD